jgi:hypothetical protein
MVQEITVRLRVDGSYTLSPEELTETLEFRLGQEYFSLDITAEVLEQEDC